MEEERAWFARKARFFQETQARQHAARDQIVALLVDVGSALDSVASFVAANTEAAQAAKQRCSELTAALDEVTMFMSTGKYPGGNKDDTAGEEGGDVELPPVLMKKLAELEDRHSQAIAANEKAVRAECSEELAKVREAALKTEIERDTMRKALENERDIAPKRIEDAVAAAVAETMEREIVVREKKVNEAVALALAVERKKVATGMNMGGGNRNMGVGGSDGSRVGSNRDSASLSAEVKQLRASLEREKSARTQAETEVAGLKEELKVAAQDLFVVKQGARDKVRRLRSKIDDLEAKNMERSSEASAHDQTKREFRNFKRLAATKAKKALDALRAEHTETMQSLRDEHRRMLNRAYQKSKEEKQKLEKLVAERSGASAKPDAGNGKSANRRASGPGTKKHRVVGSEDLTDVMILQQRVKLQKMERAKGKKEGEALIKRGKGKRGTLGLQQGSKGIEEADMKGESASDSVETMVASTPPPQKAKFHRSKHSMVLGAVSEALDVGKNAIQHPVGRSTGADGAGVSDLVVDTKDENNGTDGVQSPGTPGGFSDCEGEEAVEEEEQEIVANTRKKSKANKKNKKKNAKAAVRQGAKNVGSAAKKVGSAAKKKMVKLFGSRKKNVDGAATEEVRVKDSPQEPTTPEVDVDSSSVGTEESRERTGTFDSLESKLARWESMGEM